MKSVVTLAFLLLPAVAVAQTSSTQARYDNAATARKAAASTDPDRVICRSSPEIGSLVKRTRRCMTVTQWDQRRRGENGAARDFVRDNTGLVTGQ